MLEASDAAFMAGISHPAYRVLLEMARRAKDKGGGDQPARHYYGGWRHLAMRLGYEAPSNGPLPRGAELAVQRAITELVRAKLIENVGRTGTNRSAYFLRLWTSEG